MIRYRQPLAFLTGEAGFMRFLFGDVFFLSFTSECTHAGMPVREPRPYPCQPPGFVIPEPELWVQVAPRIREYFYFRKQAIVHGDIARLWERYPALRSPFLPDQGINSERVEVEHTQPYLDGNITFDHDFRVCLRATTMQVYVHGWEEYLLPDLNITGSEFYIRLDFQGRGPDWALMRTDTLTEAELHQCSS